MIQIYAPTKFLFGAGALNQLGEQELPGKKALLVTTGGSSCIKNGSLAKVEEKLTRAGVTYVRFAKIQANPVDTAVMEGAAFAKENGCDFIVALGGGSVIDAAKAIAVMMTNEGDIWDYIEGGTGKGLTPEKTPVPIVAVSTTAGTGSEADKYGVVSKHITNEKMAFGGYDSLYPVSSVVDPVYMTSIPPHLTAYQGFDALFHATECYLNTGSNYMSDTYAARTISLVGKYLAEAVNNGSSLEAREGMAFGSMIAGSAMMISGTVAPHAMEHAMSAYHPTLPHGAGLLMISRAFYEYVAEHTSNKEKMVEMAKLLGNTEASTAEDFVDTLVQLEEACHVADLKMSDYGITEEELPTLADNAFATMGGAFEVTPCRVDKDICVQLYKKAYR